MKSKVQRCPDCGARVRGGREGCQTAFDETFAKAYQDVELAAVRDLAFDAYCLQHPDRYCRSAKSFMAHLARLCCGIEFGRSPRVYAAIQRSLNGSRRLAKPTLPTGFGRLTIADVRAALSVDLQIQVVQAWAEGVWVAYAGQQDTARRWIAEALGASK